MVELFQMAMPEDNRSLNNTQEIRVRPSNNSHFLLLFYVRPLLVHGLFHSPESQEALLMEPVLLLW